MILKSLLMASSLLLAWTSLPVTAQQYPTKPVHLVVPGTTGTGLDVTMRFFTERLSKDLGAPFIVENKEGAGSAIGLAYVAKAPPDGYTIAGTGINLYVVPYASETPVGFDPVKDFVPIARVSGSSFVIVVAATSPHKTLQDLLRAMAAKPGELTFSSGGFGSTSQMCAMLLNDMTKTTSRHIPYRGNTQAVTDAISGQVDYTCSSGVLLPLIKGGKLRALAVTGRTRWPDLPDVPTVEEAGVPGYDLSTWIGVMAPAGTPSAVVQRLSDEFVRIAQTPEFKEFSTKQGLYVDIAGQREFAAEVPAELAKWKRLAQMTKEK